MSLKDFKVLCFDVYGTLVDWESGIVAALQPLLTANNASFTKQQLLSALHTAEAKQQAATPTMKYSDVLAAIHPQVATLLGLAVAPTEAESRAFGESVARWPAFPDTVDALRRLGRHYKLVVLSNVDREGFAGTNAGPLEGTRFDMILTAQDVGSYKPSLSNFEYMLGRVKEEFGAEKGEVLQTAQSQFHDHHPAKKMGMKSAWIDRAGAVMGNLEEEVFDWRFATLGEMADALEGEFKAE